MPKIIVKTPWLNSYEVAIFSSTLELFLLGDLRRNSEEKLRPEQRLHRAIFQTMNSQERFDNSTLELLPNGDFRLAKIKSYANSLEAKRGVVEKAIQKDGGIDFSYRGGQGRVVIPVSTHSWGFKAYDESSNSYKSFSWHYSRDLAYGVLPEGNRSARGVEVTFNYFGKGFKVKHLIKDELAGERLLRLGDKIIHISKRGD